MNNHRSDRDSKEGPERFGLLGITKRTELRSLTLFTCSFYIYVILVWYFHVLPKKTNWIEIIIEIVEHGATFFPVALVLVITFETIVLHKKSRSDKKEREINQRAMEIAKELYGEAKEDE
jgi:uncharacterized membrane protein